MCGLCDGTSKMSYAEVKEGWLHLYTEEVKDGMIAFPVTYCPWCGEKVKDSRMMPKITPRDWKYQMQEQEAEDADC